MINIYTDCFKLNGGTIFFIIRHCEEEERTTKQSSDLFILDCFVAAWLQ
jgi:hypothetical protein